MDTSTVDVAVIGLGAMGAAALYQLSARGVRVLGLDRFAPPHAMGSSHGETRITRQAVGEGAEYVPFVLAAHRIWRELEAETGDALLDACGVLLMVPGSGETTHHGKPDFVGRSIAVAREHAIPHEILDGAEVARRFPAFQGLDGSERAYFEPGGGYVRPERCIAAQLRGAAARGARIRTGVTVRAMVPQAGGVRIETSDGPVVAGRVVVSAGAWTAPLLGAPFDRLLTVNRQVLHWYDVADAAPYRGHPVYIWMHGTGDSEYFYGFPPLPGETRVKVAKEQYETRTTAEAIDRAVAPEESARMYRNHIAGRLAGALPTAHAAACLYTLTPDRGFIIDDHPDSDRILVVSACSGHGFKHSAGVGLAVAERLTEGRSGIDLSPFALSRFAAS